MIGEEVNRTQLILVDSSGYKLNEQAMSVTDNTN